MAAHGRYEEASRPAEAASLAEPVAEETPRWLVAHPEARSPSAGVDLGMEAALYLLGVVALLAGLAGLVLPAMPGAPLLVAGVVLIAWAGHFQRIGWGTVIVSAILGALIWAVDVLAGVGALLGFVVGTVAKAALAFVLLGLLALALVVGRR